MNLETQLGRLSPFLCCRCEISFPVSCIFPSDCVVQELMCKAVLSTWLKVSFVVAAAFSFRWGAEFPTFVLLSSYSLVGHGW